MGETERSPDGVTEEVTSEGLLVEGPDVVFEVEEDNDEIFVVPSALAGRVSTSCKPRSPLTPEFQHEWNSSKEISMGI